MQNGQDQERKKKLHEDIKESRKRRLHWYGRDEGETQVGRKE